MSRNKFVAIAFIPSAFGFVAWTVTLAIYESRLMGWFPGHPESSALFIAVAICFAASAILHFPAYRTEVANFIGPAAQGDSDEHVYDVPAWLLWILHAIGLVGLGLYISDILRLFDGWGGLYDVLLSETHLVRGADFDLIGIYLSYFGWMAIPLTILKWRVDKRISLVMAGLLLAQIAGNLLFIDRTRPVWLGFVSIVILFPLIKRPSLTRLLGPLAAIGAFGVIAFFAIGWWVGKTGEAFPRYGEVKVPYQLGALFYYMTSGFAYFEAIWQEAQDPLFMPERTLYPLFKALSILGIIHTEPTPQILPFIDLPFPANTATFLEPLFTDGGMAFLIPGVLFATFGIDSVALLCLRYRNALSLFFWANLCFVSFISFFVPKLPSTPVWLFATLAAVFTFFKWSRARVAHDSDGPVWVRKALPIAPTAGPIMGFEVGIPQMELAGNVYDRIEAPPVPVSAAAIPMMNRAGNPYDSIDTPLEHEEPGGEQPSR